MRNVLLHSVSSTAPKIPQALPNLNSACVEVISLKLSSLFLKAANKPLFQYCNQVIQPPNDEISVFVLRKVCVLLVL